MADKLTPQQAQAVSDRGGNLLVSAAAGSGKTKVLVDRLLMYLTDENHPANLDDFLIITYTKAAASELRSKIAEKLTQRIAQDPENKHLQKQVQRLYLTKISTVHGFCADLLREYAYLLDISADFRVADESECLEMRSRVMTELLDRVYGESTHNTDFLDFVDTQGIGRTDALIPIIVERVYDSAKCHLNPKQWLEQCLQAVDLEGIEDASQTIWGQYLIDDLYSYLDAQIRVLHSCVLQAEVYPEFVKPVTNLRDTLFQLEELRKCKTWTQIWERRNIDYGRLTFPRKNPAPELSERIKAVRNACKKGIEKKLVQFANPSSQIMEDLSQTLGGTRGLIELVRQFDTDYSRLKHVRRVVDFSDLEHKTLDLLLGKARSGPTAAAFEVGARFREIMVDEYQDSNGVQDAIFTALTEKKHNCFMVGDVKQSIYQFRLADPGIFLNKYASFAPAEEAAPAQDRKVMLCHNFRSGCEIVEAVNDVFSVCMSKRVGGLPYGDTEKLREGIPHEPLPDPAVELYAVDVQEETYPEEACVVAERIQNMLRTGILIRDSDGMRPVTAEDIVILLRSPGSIGMYYQKALESRGIRCNSGNGNDLLISEEVATLRAFLQIIENPRQDIPLITTLASPIFGFSADDLAAVRSDKRKGYYYEALLESDHIKAKHFLSVVEALRIEARMNPLTKLLKKCFQLTRLDSIYGAMEDGANRQLNLQQFYQLAVEYEAGGSRDLGQFLHYLESLENRGLMAAGTSGTGVSIMSIHKSKGLEFPVVFLCGLSRNFNKESLNAQILCDKELGVGLSVTDSENRIRYPSISKRAIASKMAAESLSEEMRILYVALTRARDRLVMTYASKNLQSDLQNIALRMDLDHGQLLCMDAPCPGDWVLLAAMGRMEAGALHALGGRPDRTVIARFPWNISVVEGQKTIVSASQPKSLSRQLPPNTFTFLENALSFHYSHWEATAAPSKQTATGLKGRIKDEEAAEMTPQISTRSRSWRRPGFAASSVKGIEYGNALHGAMQYIRYESCNSLDAVEEEISRLVREGFISHEQSKMIDIEKIAAFFSTPIGKKLCAGTECLREYKFSILCDGHRFGEGLEGEKVLLQGVVDCALIEEDGITIVDFKSDHVTEDTVCEAVRRYKIQLQTYSNALSRIFEMPVKECLLYFFRLNRFFSVSCL